MIIRLTIIEPLARQIGGALAGGTTGGIGGLWSSITSAFGGGKASGGPVVPSSWYVTGEEGPELFVPKVPGMILPADVTRDLLQGGRGGGGGVVINFNGPVNNAAQVREGAQQAAARLARLASAGQRGL
jgi:hypothetical protein